MGAVYEEFQRDLASWQRKYAGRPRQEMIHLFLLALEREELVSLAYREAAIVRRLATMPLDAEVRDLIHHALIWVWKDEEMHSVYIRGAILKLGSLRLKVTAYLRQFAGAIGGWSSSVQHHARWTQAPFSRALAAVNTWAGGLIGKVPRDVKEHLRYGPFRRFCLFNIDAEDTARVCWQRLVELASSQPDVSPHLVEDFRRIRDDEERHGRVFRILAGALDDDDRLVPGETARTLVHKIRDVGEFFLPRSYRRSREAISPLAAGGPVYSLQGHTPEEKLPLFRRLLDDLDVGRLLRARADVLGKPVGELRVVVKTAFMLGYHHKDTSHVTDPALVEELACYLRGQGCSDVAVLEAPNIYDQFYHKRTVRDVAEYFGIRSPHYRLVDLGEEQVPHSYYRGLAQYTVGKSWKEADYRISFGKMCSHPIELVFLTIGNVEWIGARCDEFLFPERQAHRETAVMMLLDAFPPHLGLVDAYDRAADGLIGIMGCPRPPSPKRLYGGTDVLSVDLVAARHMGLKNPEESRTLQMARHWFGDPTARIEVCGADEPIRGWRSPYDNELTTLLSFFAAPVYQYGSGRGTLFVPEMDETAFPPIQRPGRVLSLLRRMVQTLLGIRHKKQQ
jgi:hypothetical protein